MATEILGKKDSSHCDPPLNTSLIEAIVEVIMIWLYGIQQSYSLHTTSIAWLLMKAKESGKKSYYDYNDFSWEINAIKSQEHTLI